MRDGALESQEDSDSETGGIQGTVIAVLDFLATILEKKAFRPVVEVGVPPLIPAIMVFLQPSASQIESWTEDPDRFVEEEDDEVRVRFIGYIRFSLEVVISSPLLSVRFRVFRKLQLS